MKKVYIVVFSDSDIISTSTIMRVYGNHDLALAYVADEIRLRQSSMGFSKMQWDIEEMEVIE